MDMTEYVEAAIRTESRIDNVKVNASIIDSRKLHAIMGLATEAGEYLDAFKKHIYYGREMDTVNLQEEIGDMMWYLAILCDTYKFDLQDLIVEARSKRAVVQGGVASWSEGSKMDAKHFWSGFRLFQSVSKLLDTIQPGGDNMKFLIEDLVFEMGLTLTALGTTWEDEADRNISKLKARYPEKFTSEAANERDLDKERAVLEA